MPFAISVFALWKKKSPKSNSEPDIGLPSTRQCLSTRCQPRGRTSSTAVFSASAYFLPSGLVNPIVPSIASRRLIWPSILFCQVGEFESSKSAMKTFAPEFSALMTILRSTGPVISTRRSSRSFGIGATVHSFARISAVSAGKSGSAPPSISACTFTRAASRSTRVASNAGPVRPEIHGFGGQNLGISRGDDVENLDALGNSW